MPDFTDVVYFHCQSVEEYEAEVKGSTGKTYKVRVGYSKGGPTKFAWSCDCPGFKFRHRCKHIETAKQDYCGWLQMIGGGEIVRDKNNVPRCPECGNIAIAQRHAV
jgi:hypothetical protein